MKTQPRNEININKNPTDEECKITRIINSLIALPNNFSVLGIFMDLAYFYNFIMKQSIINNFFRALQ